MNTVGLIALSLLAGVILVIIIGGLATLILLHIRVQKSHTALVNAIEKFTADIASSSGQAADNLERLVEDAGREFCDIAVQYKDGLIGIVESARSSFSGIRQDMKTSQDGQSREIAAALKEQTSAVEVAVGKINGEALIRASVEALRALKELSALTVTLKNLLVDHSAPAADLGPEEYGPSDQFFVQTSDTARMDAQTQREETSAYTNQFDAGLPVVRTDS